MSTGQNVSGINFGNIPTGQIEGRKFHDIDADNFRDASEPWLNGWTITLTNSSGVVVGTAVTGDLDRDGNGQIDPATNAAVTLSNSGGTDVRRIQSSQVGSLTLGGPGSSLIQGSTVNGGLTSSSNGITNLAVIGSTVTGATNVSGSALNDNAIVSRSIFGGAFTVAGNAGNDVVALINRSEFNAAVSIAGDAGNDTFGLRTLNAFRGTAASFDGGQGTDNVASDGASRTPTVRRTESNNNATLNNLIDLALSNFEDLMLDI